MLAQSGIPVIYSGDEIGQLNDYTYHDDADKQADSRYLHRGKLNWQNVEKRTAKSTPESVLYSAVTTLEQIRRQYPVFTAAAEFEVTDTGSDHVLGIRREYEKQKLYAFFNFSGTEQSAFFDEILTATDLISGKTVRGLSAVLQPYGFLWLLCDE